MASSGKYMQLPSPKVVEEGMLRFASFLVFFHLHGADRVLTDQRRSGSRSTVIPVLIQV